MLRRKDILDTYPERYPLTPSNLRIAKKIMADLWNERRRESGLEPSDDRSGSCKFAALLARELFGGRLAGNHDHVFVLKNEAVLDLNEDQEDVRILGAEAHVDDGFSLLFQEYRESLGSCMNRVKKAVTRFDAAWKDYHLERSESLFEY